MMFRSHNELSIDPFRPYCSEDAIVVGEDTQAHYDMDVISSINNTAEFIDDLMSVTLPASASRYGVDYSIEGHSTSQ